MTKQHKIAVQAKIKKDSTIGTLALEDRIEFQENDNISHFICRLAYCRNEELRKWFITQETRLFSIRLSEFQPIFIKQLLESKLGIIYEELKATDKVWIDFEAQIKYLSDALYYKNTQTGLSMASLPQHFVKVPFKEAISLVGRR